MRVAVQEREMFLSTNVQSKHPRLTTALSLRHPELVSGSPMDLSAHRLLEVGIKQGP